MVNICLWQTTCSTFSSVLCIILDIQTAELQNLLTVEIAYFFVCIWVYNLHQGIFSEIHTLGQWDINIMNRHQMHCFHLVYRDYFMESASVRDFHTSWWSIWNRTSQRSERVRFLIQNLRVWKSRTKCFPCSNLFSSYILRFLLLIQL